MLAVKRRFPRIPLDIDTELCVRRRERTAGEAQKVHLRGAIRAMSCGGIGIALAEPDVETVRRGDQVTVRFFAARESWLLPGTIVWARESTASDQRLSQRSDQALHLGVRFRLELTTAKTRTSFARWIVAQTDQKD